MTLRFDNAQDQRDDAEQVFATLLASWHESRQSGKPQEATPGDSAASAVVLQRRLSRAKECLELLDRIWPAPPDRIESGTHPSQTRRFGRYLVERELGSGAHGVVFMALDEDLKRPVALKVPRPEVLGNEELRRRFLREAEANAKLDHPHIVPIYEVGVEGVVCYIASAYCDGGSLHDWLSRRSQPVPPREAAQIVAELARAVHHGHSRGVLHRDLKPANILLMSRDEELQNADCRLRIDEKSNDANPQSDSSLLARWAPKIADFGLAKVLDDDGESTLDGIVMGTANYMSPEQAAGQKEEIGTATDVYALGVILYELLTGSPPFRAASYLATLQMVNAAEPVWPSELRNRIPRDLRTICLKCLEKDPQARYSSAAALVEDLERFLRGDSVLARPAGATERAARWVRRHPGLALLSSLAAALAIGFLVQLLIHYRQLAQVNADLVQAVADAKQAAAASLASQSLAEERAEENRRHAFAGKLRLIQQFSEAGNLRHTTTTFLETLPQLGADEDFRGFAWRYWWNRCRHGELFAFPGHGSIVYDAVHSPSGLWIATTSSDSTVRIWDAANGRELARLDGFQDTVTRVAVSTDGSLVAAGDSIGNIRVWRTSDWKFLQAWFRHRKEIRGLCFLDERTLISGGEDGDLRRTDAASGNELGHYSMKGRGVGSLALVRTKNLLLVGTNRGELQFRTLPELTLISNVKNHSSSVVRIAVSPQGDRAVTSDNDGGLRIWDVADRRSLLVIAEPDYRASPVAFAPSGTMVAARTAAGLLRLLDAESGAVKFERQMEVEDLQALDFSSDGKSILVAGEGGLVAYWQPFQAASPQIEGHPKEAWSVAFAPGGTTLASGSDDGTVRVWEIASGKLQKALTPPPVPDKPNYEPGTVSSLAYSPDGSLLAGTVIEHELPETVRIWRMPEGELLHQLRGHSEATFSVAFHPTDPVLATGGLEVILWDSRTGEKKATLPANLPARKKVKSIAFSRDGSMLAHASEEGAAYLYDYRSLKLRHKLISGGEVWAVAFSPSSKLLATGNRDGIITVWDAQSGKLQHVHKGHLGGVRSVAYTHDGKSLASCGEDRTIKLWDALTGNELCTLSGHQADVYDVAFSQDDQWLGSCSHDGAVKLWHAPRVPEGNALK